MQKYLNALNEIPSISGLTTTSALTAVEDKIPSVSNLVIKTDCDTKVREIEKKITDRKHDEYIPTLYLISSQQI